MRTLFVAATLAALAVLLVIAPVSAGVLWCAKDPIVALNGTEVQILVSVPDDMQSAVNGPIGVRIKTPAGVSQQLVFTDAGFNGHGELVVFGANRDLVAADGSFDARIEVVVPADRKLLKDLGLKKGELPMLVTIITGGVTTSVEGTNAGISLAVRVTPAP